MNNFNRLRWLGLTLLAFALASCQTVLPTRTAVTARVAPINFCSVFTVVHYSMKDTETTVQQVQANNAVWHRLCGQ